MSLSFEQWLESEMQGYEAQEDISVEQLAEHIIRFNNNIAEISDGRSDEELVKGIEFIYGCSENFCSLSHLDPCELIEDVFSSIRVLYRDLFEKRCGRFCIHLNWGSEAWRPLNSPCYMLWDMTLGVDSFWLSGKRKYIESSINLLVSLSESTHLAVIESAIHGLGEMSENLRSDWQPALERILNSPELPSELKQYAYDAAYNYIL